MKSKKKSKKIVIQAVKAARKQSREEEIKTYSKPLNYKKVIQSKKVYNRKKTKADQQNDLPLLLSTNYFAVY